MIFKETKLKAVDNSGANLVKCIDVLNKSKSKGAIAGDLIVVSIQSKRLQKQIKKGQMHRGVYVRSTKNLRRVTGNFIKFGDNALLIVNAKNIPMGSRVYGPISQELRWTTHTKVVSIAKLII